MHKIIILALAAWVSQLSAVTMTLEECFKQALNNNISLKVNEIDQNLSENERKGALYNFYDLNGNYNGVYSYGKISTDAAPDLTNHDLNNKAGLALNARLGFGLIDNYKLKKLAVNSTDLATNKARFDLLQSVTEKFYDLASKKEELDMKKEQIELSRLQYEQEKLKLQLGNSTKSELFAAEVEYSADSLAIFTTETQVNQQKQILISLINSKESYQSFDISINKADLEKYEPVVTGVENLITEALNSRADYIAQKNALAASQISLDIAKDKYLPTATASLATDYMVNKNLEDDVLTKTFDYKASLGLSWSVDLLSDCNNVDRNKLIYQQSRLALENKENIISSEVKNVYLSVKMQEQQLLQSRKHLELTKQNLELAEEMYRLGKKSLIEMVSAKNNYITAKQMNIDARYKYKIAYSQLMNTIGK